MSGEKMTFESPTAIVHLTRMMRQMRALKWTPGKSTRAYAAKHDISADQAARYSAEAWRRCKNEVLDKERVGATAGMVAERIMIEAYAESHNPAWIDRGSKTNGEPNTTQESPNVARKVALEAAKVLVAIAGASAPERHELTGKDGAPIEIDVSKMTDEQLLAIVARSSSGGVGDPSTSASSREADGVHPSGDAEVQGAEASPTSR